LQTILASISHLLQTFSISKSGFGLRTRPQ